MQKEYIKAKKDGRIRPVDEDGCEDDPEGTPPGTPSRGHPREMEEPEKPARQPLARNNPVAQQRASDRQRELSQDQAAAQRQRQAQRQSAPAAMAAYIPPGHDDDIGMKSGAKIGVKTGKR